MSKRKTLTMGAFLGAHMAQNAETFYTVECASQSCAGRDENRVSKGTTEHVSDPIKEKCLNGEYLWHRVFGHFLPVRCALDEKVGSFLPVVTSSALDCTDCSTRRCRKQLEESVASSDRLGRVNYDTEGKGDVSSNAGHKYILAVADPYSLYNLNEMMRQKSEA